MIAKFGRALLLLLAFAAPLAAEPFQHSTGEWREYNRDWLAACPPTIDENATDYYGFSCFASTASQELNSANLPAYKLTILRNRLTGDIDLAITVAAENAEVDTSRSLILAFGGDNPELFDFSTDLETRYNIINQYYITDPARKAAVLERLKQRNALRLTVPLTGAPSSKETWLSLRGVAASLDFMEAYARRVAQY